MIGLVVIPVLAYLVLYIFALFNSDEMDINNDGFITPTEAGYFDDSGKREIEINGKKCIDYFAYKDGLSLKVTCEE